MKELTTTQKCSRIDISGYDLTGLNVPYELIKGYSRFYVNIQVPAGSFNSSIFNGAMFRCAFQTKTSYHNVIRFSGSPLTYNSTTGFIGKVWGEINGPITNASAKSYNNSDTFTSMLCPVDLTDNLVQVTILLCDAYNNYIEIPSGTNVKLYACE